MCGQEGVPQNPKVVKELLGFVNNMTVNADSFLAVTFPIDWIKYNPNFLEKIPKTSEIVVSDTLEKQFDLNENWLSKNWMGICNELTNVTQPTH